MTSKHYRWQTRWQLDQAAGIARHESGLIVSFTADSGGAGQAENAEATLAALAVKNGPHNAPNMLRRLLNEAAELYANSSSNPQGKPSSHANR